MRRTALVGLALVVVSTAVWCEGCSDRGHEGEKGAGPKARVVLHYRDPMHPSYTSPVPGKAPDCGMDLEPVYADDAESGGVPALASKPGTVFVSTDKQRLIGVRLGRVERSRISGTLRTLGRVAIDENRVFPVRTGCDGWVTRVFPDAVTGSTVRRGQPLAAVYGRDFSNAQRSFLYALRASENPPPSFPGDPSSQPALTLQEARLQLQNLGIGEVQIGQLAQTRQVMLDIQLVAPAGGVIVARNVALQQRFEKDVELFRIADLTHVWIVADLLGDDQTAIRAGDTASVSLPGAAGRVLHARVSDTLPRFDGASRALKVRLDADNPQRVLRPDMIVDLEFAISLPEATIVPAEAIVESGDASIVYVASGEGAFEPRTVETGWRFEGSVQIVGGLTVGESIVVSGNVLLDAESRMRRGDAGRHD